MDALNYSILEILKKDSRTPFTEVGKDLGVSDATVHVRVNRMVEEGIIKRFTLEVNEETISTRVHSFVFMNVQPGRLEEVAKQLVDNEWTIGIYEIHGSNDLIIKLEAESLGEMRDQILKIREIPNVTTSEMTTVYKTWKENKF